FIQRPSDLGHSDEGYVLPDLDVRYHEIPSDYAKAGHERDGQALMFTDPALSLSAASNEKRDSMPARVEKVRELVTEAPADHFIVWHDLEDERHAIQQAIPEAVSVWGSQHLDEREQRIIDFGDGKHRLLSTKPIIAGSGCNFQRHCHREIFAGIGFKFNDFIQAIHRVQRFGQTHTVRIDIIHSEAEREVLRTLLAKWAQHEEMQAKMTTIIREYGLNQLAMQETLARSIGVKRIEVTGDRFAVANNDCVEEARLLPDNHVDLIVTSIPFANHYEYSPSYNDFGHTEDNAHFWQQMDYLTPQLLRILKPGRIYACHVKDRILFGNVTGAGIPTYSPFHAEALFHGMKHGFDYCGMITVNTDVVRENNQTYRLGYTEMCKDGSKMSVGSPEYVLLFHKPQSDRSKGYADVPIRKSKNEYSLARWQIDAHAFWRSSGERLLTAEELAALGPDKLASLFTKYSLENVYDYEFHVKIGEELQQRGALPSTFMSLAPGSHDPNIWHDVTRMLTLNGEQARRAVEKHVCPLQFDIVDRLIERYSNKDELVYDPFCGLGTVPYRAILKGRRGGGSELNPTYFMDQVHYLKSAERKFSMPTLFDLDQAA
ncbi:MAG: DNA methyltransferase, partial [Pseudomonadota bacterium]